MEEKKRKARERGKRDSAMGHVWILQKDNITTNRKDNVSTSKYYINKET